MHSVILRTLAVIGVGAVILAGVLYVASTVDGRPPTVLDMRLTQPLPGDERQAAITTSVEVIFSELIDADSATGAVRLEPDVQGSISWSGSTLTFTPSQPLALDTAYSLVVDPGIRDLAGNSMADLPAPFEFRTAGRPALVASVPADGAADVALDEPITLTFTTLMDTASVESALRVSPAFDHQLRWSGRMLQIAPVEPLTVATDYEITIGTDATDVTGVALAEPGRVRFRTVEPGLSPRTLVPADAMDGIAVTSPIAIVFDRPVDPSSASSSLLTITPAVAGTARIERLPEEVDAPGIPDGAGSMLVFTPSAPLPPNTTFSVELAPGLASVAGGSLATPVRWTFTTGVPMSGISNQITFLTDRGGIANVWAMNPDGSGQRQLSAELSPVIDYVVGPTGDALVLADGWRLVFQRADGSERRVLTDVGVLEFDPTFSPDGRHVAFARADALTGAGLGLWEWSIGGGEAEPIGMPLEVGATPTPEPSGESAAATVLRAPRYAPDGQALAFIDTSGAVGLLELPSGRLTRAPFDVGAAPAWLADSSGVLLTGRPLGSAVPIPTVKAPVDPLGPELTDGIFILLRSGTTIQPGPFGTRSQVLAVAAGGPIAYVDVNGALWLANGIDAAPGRQVLSDPRLRGAAFAPGADRLVIETQTGAIELLDPSSSERVRLVSGGSQPRWLP